MPLVQVKLIVVNGNAADADTLTFFGTNAMDLLKVNLDAVGTAPDPVRKLLDAAGLTDELILINYTGFNTLNVNCLDGNDTVNVHTSNANPISRSLFLDGGLPKGKNKGTDTLNIFDAPKRPGIVKQGGATQDPDSGIVTLDYGNAFFSVAYASMEVVTIQKY